MDEVDLAVELMEMEAELKRRARASAALPARLLKPHQRRKLRWAREHKVARLLPPIQQSSTVQMSQRFF